MINPVSLSGYTKTPENRTSDNNLDNTSEIFEVNNNMSEPINLPEKSFNQEMIFELAKNPESTPSDWMDFINDLNTYSDVKKAFTKYVCEITPESKKNEVIDSFVNMYNKASEENDDSTEFDKIKFEMSYALIFELNDLTCKLLNTNDKYLKHFCNSYEHICFYKIQDSATNQENKNNLMYRLATSDFIDNDQKNRIIAQLLEDDINAKGFLNLPKTAQNLDKYFELINEDNINYIQKAYKNSTGKSLQEAIEGEWGLSKDKKHELISKLQGYFKEKYGYQKQYSNKSAVNNEHYQGLEFSQEQSGDIMTITNSETGEVFNIDFEDLTKNIDDVEIKSIIKADLQQLPAEVLIDMAIESNIFYKTPHHIKDANAFYSYTMDTINLNDDLPAITTITHELAHALDFNADNIPLSQSGNFNDTFNKELSKYTEAGHKKYSSDNPDYDEWNYATYSQREMFAECYTLLMLGSCNSKDCIEKYFPETLEAAKENIKTIRSHSKEERTRVGMYDSESVYCFDRIKEFEEIYAYNLEDQELTVPNILKIYYQSCKEYFREMLGIQEET